MGNLRVEGKAANHLILGSSLDLFGLKQDTVDVLETDLVSLQSFQVDLAHLFPVHTKNYLATSGVEAALWICPPKWPHPAASFQEFSVPVVELQRRLEGVDGDFFVRIRKDGQ